MPLNRISRNINRIIEVVEEASKKNSFYFPVTFATSTSLTVY
jgi:hypothetical protein